MTRAAKTVLALAFVHAGAFYMRLVGRPLEVYQYLEPLYNDYRKVRLGHTHPQQHLSIKSLQQHYCTHAQTAHQRAAYTAGFAVCFGLQVRIMTLEGQYVLRHMDEVKDAHANTYTHTY